MDCILNLRKHAENEEGKNTIGEIKTDINEISLRNKQEYINIINEEFRKVNRNFRTLDKGYLENFFNKYCKDKFCKDYLKSIIAQSLDTYLHKNIEPHPSDNHEWLVASD